MKTKKKKLLALLSAFSLLAAAGSAQAAGEMAFLEDAATAAAGDIVTVAGYAAPVVGGLMAIWVGIRVWKRVRSAG